MVRRPAAKIVWNDTSISSGAMLGLFPGGAGSGRGGGMVLGLEPLILI